MPKPNGARPFSPPSEQDGAWAQSFDVKGLGPVDSVKFYETALVGWAMVSPPVSVGGCTGSGALGDGCYYSGVWTNTAQRLEITAGPAGSDGTTSDAGQGVQLNLVLIPAG